MKKHPFRSEDELWIDVGKGALVSGVFCLILATLFLTIISEAKGVMILFLFGFIGLEVFFLYRFFFQESRKHLQVHGPYFFAGILSGFVVIVFFLTFMAAFVR